MYAVPPPVMFSQFTFPNLFEDVLEKHRIPKFKLLACDHENDHNDSKEKKIRPLRLQMFWGKITMRHLAYPGENILYLVSFINYARGHQYGKNQYKLGIVQIL